MNTIKYIGLGKKQYKVLKAEFLKSETNPNGCSRQTIHEAMRYQLNSELAKKMRARAKELLEQELAEIVI